MYFSVKLGILVGEELVWEVSVVSCVFVIVLVSLHERQIFKCSLLPKLAHKDSNVVSWLITSISSIFSTGPYCKFACKEDALRVLKQGAGRRGRSTLSTPNLHDVLDKIYQPILGINMIFH